MRRLRGVRPVRGAGKRGTALREQGFFVPSLGLTLESLKSGTGQSNRSLNAKRFLADSAHADADESIAFQDIKRPDQ